MSNRLRGSEKYPHTQADEDFNRLMEKRDQADAKIPKAAGQIAFGTEQTRSVVVIDAPQAGDLAMQPAEVQHEHPLIDSDHPVAS